MRSPLLAALTASLLLVGCGGSGDGKGSGASTPKTLEVDAGQMIEVTADEYSFGPSKVIVTAPDDHPVQVKFSLKNAGALPHDMTVLDGEDVLGATSIFGPGKTGEGQATLAAGTYKFVCSVGDHANLGMKGTLIVRAPAG